MKDAYFGADYSTTLLVWYFFILIGCIFYLMDLIDLIIPDVEEDVSCLAYPDVLFSFQFIPFIHQVTTQLRRRDFLEARIIDLSTGEEVYESAMATANMPSTEALDAKNLLLGLSKDPLTKKGSVIKRS